MHSATALPHRRLGWHGGEGAFTQALEVHDAAVDLIATESRGTAAPRARWRDGGCGGSQRHTVCLGHGRFRVSGRFQVFFIDFGDFGEGVFSKATSSRRGVEEGRETVGGYET